MHTFNHVLLNILLGLLVISCYPALSSDEPLKGDIMNVKYEMGIAEINDDLELELLIFTADIPDSPAFLEEKESVVQENPDDANALIDAGKAQLKAKKWEDAESSFSKVIESDPANQEGWEGYFLALYKLKKYDMLLQESNALIKLQPDWALGFLNKGVALRSQKEFLDALVEIDRAIQREPNSSTAWNVKGETLSTYELWKFGEAIVAFDQAIKINPEYALAWNNKGIAYNFLHKYDLALEMFNQAVMLDPQNPDFLINQAGMLRDLDRYDEAIQVYETAMQYAPARAGKIWRDIGGTYDSADRDEEALQAYDKAIELGDEKAKEQKNILLQNMGEYWKKQGYNLSSSKQYTEALDAYEKSLDYYPENHFTWALIGHTYMELEKYAKAVTAFEKALELVPDYDSYEDSLEEARQALNNKK